MTRTVPPAEAEPAALAYQEAVLPLVSRTFALTIPQLPPPLRNVVANAYLLCRIADTIEDEPTLSDDRKQRYQERFGEIVAGREAAQPFVDEIAPLLSDRTLEAERDLVRNTATVLRVTAGFTPVQRAVIERCVVVMCQGMRRFQQQAGTDGLKDLAELDAYCYYVAGVVGEMLTDLFCDYSPEIARNREAMMSLAVSFGQGLQMTNILKDVWDDLGREVCWYPRSVFERYGFDLSRLSASEHGEPFAAGLHDLVAVAHSHLRGALAYTLMIPPHETGIRRFCAWAIGMAVLTLRRIEENPRFTSGAEVKISRRAVGWTMLLTSICARSDRWLIGLFDRAAASLPAPRTRGVETQPAPAPDEHSAHS